MDNISRTVCSANTVYAFYGNSLIELLGAMIIIFTFFISVNVTSIEDKSNSRKGYRNMKNYNIGQIVYVAQTIHFNWFADFPFFMASMSCP